MSDNEGLLCACDRRGGRLHDFGPDCGPRVYPARRDAPDLPPVGELVQITVQDADEMATGLGQLRPDGTRFESLDWPPGIPVSLVTSWCRVLVLPDDDETVSRVADGLVPLEYVARLLPDLRAALREAAIR